MSGRRTVFDRGFNESLGCFLPQDESVNGCHSEDKRGKAVMLTLFSFKPLGPRASSRCRSTACDPASPCTPLILFMQSRIRFYRRTGQCAEVRCDERCVKQSNRTYQLGFHRVISRRHALSAEIDCGRGSVRWVVVEHMNGSIILQKRELIEYARPRSSFADSTADNCKESDRVSAYTRTHTHTHKKLGRLEWRKRTSVRV